MRSLGIRPAVIEGTRAAPRLVANGVIEKPKAFDDYRALNHLREKLQSIISDRDVDIVRVRENDYGKGAKQFYPRVRAEAIALETAVAEGKQVDLVGWPTIASALGIAGVKDKKKGYMTESSFRGIDCSGLGTEGRDAIHAAVAGLPQ